MSERESIQVQKTMEALSVHKSVRDLQHAAINNVSLNTVPLAVHDTLRSSTMQASPAAIQGEGQSLSDTKPVKEFFPEAFSLYNTDPEWMQTNLLDLFDWFEKLSKTSNAPPP
jgi:hypothetical protein